MGSRKAQQTGEAFDYAAQWADGPKHEELTLPSGKRVTVRNPDLPALAQRGLIPADKIGAVERFVLQGVTGTLAEIGGDGEGKPEGTRLTLLGDFNTYVDAYCVAAVVEPALSFDGKPGTVAIARLDPNDRMDIWRWGAGLARSGAAATSATTPAGEAASEPAAEATEASPPGAGEPLGDTTEPVAADK